MYEVPINGCKKESVDETNYRNSDDYSENDYMSRPEDYSNRSVFDYEPLPNESANKWLTDYGWL